MKTKYSVTVLAIAVIVIALFAPTLAQLNAKENNNDSIVSLIGSGGHVVLQLPEGIPSHPTTLAMEVFSFNEQSSFGAMDVIITYNWVPARNNFAPVAIITNSQNPDFYTFGKQVVMNTPMWTPSAGMLNIFQVTDSQLEIEMQGDVLTTNLTVPINITLTAAFGGNFTLPPTALQFRAIGNAFNDEVSTPMLPSPPLSGYVITMDLTDKPAWVHLWNSQWVGTNTAFFEFTGTLYQHVTRTYQPPTA